MKSHRSDYALLGTIIFLVVFGLIMIASSSINLSQDKFNENYYYLKNQIWHGLLPGLILGLLAYFVPLKYFKKISLPLLILNLVFLVLVFAPGLGLAHGGAQRWINLGSFSFQPSEFLKLSFILFLANWFSSKGKDIKSFSRTLIPFLILLAAVLSLLLIQPDLGTMGVVGLSAVLVYLLAGESFFYVSLILSGAAVLFFIMIKTFSHAASRFQIFLHPEMDPLGKGYHLNQAFLALGSGGFLGLGLGQGLQKFRYLPEPATDSILAVIGEELGFIGVISLILLFLFFVSRGLKISSQAPDEFSRLLAGGITIFIVLQTLINMASVCGLFPLTGIPLPFISLGGTSLTVNLAAVGILLNISKYSK